MTELEKALARVADLSNQLEVLEGDMEFGETSALRAYRQVSDELALAEEEVARLQSQG